MQGALGWARSALRGLARYRGAFGKGRLAGALLLMGLLLLRAWEPQPVEALAMRAFDLLQQANPRAESAFPVVIVDIDEESLEALGQWPWPRTVIGRLVERLAGWGAAAIGFDMVFAEPDRTSPGEFLRFAPDLPQAAREALLRLPSNDAVFARSLAGRRVVLGQAVLTEADEAPPPSPAAAAVAEIGGNPRPFLYRFEGVLRNLPEIEAAGAGAGLFSLAPEVDGFLRRVPLAVAVGESIRPALAVEMLRVASGQSAWGLRVDRAGVAAVVVSGVSIPTDRRGRVTVRFGPHDARRFVSAADVLNDRVDPARFAGRLVLVGTSAAGLGDLRATPVATAMPGVEVHAQLLETILSGSYLIRPNYALGLELLVTLAAGMALVVLVPMVGARYTLALLVAICAAAAGGSWYAFVEKSYLVDGAFPIAASVLLYLLLVYAGQSEEERRRKQVSQAFGRYLSPVLVQQLARSPDRLKLGGELRDMTIMFADVRGFTSLSERLRDDPEALTSLINRFLTPMTDSVLEFGGTIDKYIGDCVMAFWNAPLPDERHAANACGAALAMLAALARLNEELAAAPSDASHPIAGLRLDMGIGINTGRCIVGNMGSLRRFDYSVLGDPVNLASRLEAQSKNYGMPVILSEFTRRLAPDYAALELDLIAVKGKTEAVRVFGLMGGPELAGSEGFLALQRDQAAMLAAYRAGDWAAARGRVAGCRKHDAGLGVLYDAYARRIDVLEAAPPPHWNGVFVAEKK